MIIYFVALTLSLLCCFLSKKSANKALKYIFAISSALPFFLLAAFRSDSVGIDTWKNYSPTFTNLAYEWGNYDMYAYLSGKYEIGFSTIMIILTFLSKSPVILYIVGSAIITFFTYTAIYQQSKKPWLSILIFFLSGAFLLSMNGMRGYMALAISLYALKYIPTKHPIKYILFIILAATLHVSSIVFILLYPLYNLILKARALIIILVCTILLTPVIYNIAYALLKNTSYINYFNASPSYGFINPLYSMLIINLAILFLFFLNYNRCYKEKTYNLFLKLQLLSVIICILSFKLPLSYRAEQIIDFYQIITIPYNIYLIQETYGKKKIYYALLALSISMYSVYFTRVFILSNDNQVRDYSSVITGPSHD